jgi:hypothetical protein
MTTEEKTQQVSQQCKAVAHMAKALMEVHADYESIVLGVDPGITELVGERTARFMELLGDMLNEMDANDESDDWMEPVFAEAQRLWPSPERKEPQP